jgi:peroxiredoxin
MLGVSADSAKAQAKSKTSMNSSITLLMKINLYSGFGVWGPKNSWVKNMMFTEPLL